MSKINFNFSEEAAEGVKMVAEQLVKGIKILVPIVGLAVLSKRESKKEELDDYYRVIYRDSTASQYSYGDAVNAIVDSGMLASYKNEALGKLKKGEDSDYYKAVISIVNSGMLSGYKIEAIENVSK